MEATFDRPYLGIYNRTGACCGLKRACAIAIEDTVNGCMAATRAGIRTLVTTHFFTRHHHFPQASLVVDSLGNPDSELRVINGDAGDNQWVSVDLLREIVNEGPLALDPAEWETSQTATA